MLFLKPCSIPAVDHDIVEGLLELSDEALHVVRRDGVLVARLGGGEQEQALDPLVLDQRLLQLALALDDVHEVVHDPVLEAEDDVEVAEPDVRVDDRDLVPGQRQRTAEVGGRRRLADAALPGGDHDALCHEISC
jgi:hypothetical protein